MKKFLLTIILIIMALTACAPVTDIPIATNPPATATQPDDVSTIEPSTLQPSDSSPRPSDSNLVRGNVLLDSTDLLTMESFPLQFMLVLKGGLPTPCHELRVAVSPPDVQNKIVVDVYSVVDPNSICAQVVEPFEENFPLGSFPSGHYTLWVNGEQVAEFDS